MKISVLISSFLFQLSIVSMGQETNFKKFKSLSGPEKCWVIFHPFVAKKTLIISEMARQETKDIISNSILKGNGNSGQVDAFRHTFWMANLTIEIGWRRSKRLGIAHEKGNYNDYKKRKNEDGAIPDKISSEMDLFNNNLGVYIGKTTAKKDLKDIVISAVKTGKCKIIKKDNDGNYLDCNGVILINEKMKGKWENDKCLVWSNN